MTTIGPLSGPAQAATRSTLARPGTGDFALPSPPLPSPPPEGARLGGLESLLSLQEVGGAEDAAAQAAQARRARDRAAQGRARALLATLAAVQHSLLCGDDGGAADRLRALLEDVPDAADPALAALASAIVLRARVELARRGG